MLKSYIGIFKMEFKGELQYRAKAISGIATQFFWGLLQIYLYMAFMTSDTINGLTLSQLSSYVWLGQAFFAMRFITMNKKIGKDITNGNVCYKFVRPIDMYEQSSAEGIGQKLASTLLKFAPIIIIAIFLPPNLRLYAPVNFIAFVLFVLSLILGLLMSHTISMFAIFLTFKTLSDKGSVGIVFLILNLFSGVIIFIPLFFLFLQNILNYLPFRFISDLPFRIYIGNISTHEGLIYLAIGFAWLIVLIILGKNLIKYALKKTIIQGG